MRAFLRTHVATLAFIAATASVACGQAVPASSMSPSVGPGMPSIDGVFHYALSGSELLQTGNGSGLSFSTALSGDASYNSRSVVRPFSMTYAGGVLLGNQYGQRATTFQNLALSQGLVAGAWIFGISDSVSYLPQSPTLGLSGIPGVGDLGSQPIQGPSTGPAGGVLTNNSTNLSNSLSGDVERRLTALTSVSGVGSWSILRFPKGNGLENTQISAQGALNHRLDVRDTISGSGTYSTFSYGSGIDLSIQTRGANLAFQRVVSRKLSISASAGPMWISSSNSALVPSRLTVATDLSVLYSRKFTTAAISYTRGVNGGSGVQPGALSDSVSATAARTYGRDWMASLSANYTHTGGLVQNAAVSRLPALALLYASGTTNLEYGGAQVSRRLTDSLSAFASYNLQHQSIDSTLVLQNAYSGFTQTFGIGITFSPRSTRLGQF
jgi:hypothetical protein